MWFSALCVAASVVAAPQPATKPGSSSIVVDVGSRRRVAIPPAHGVIFDDAEVAEVELVAPSQVDLVGVGPGRGQLIVVQKDGKVREYPVEVRGTGVRASARPPDPPAENARFGGQRLRGA